MSLQNKGIIVTGRWLCWASLSGRPKTDGLWVRGGDLKYLKYEQATAYEFEILDLRKWDNCLQATRGIDQVYNFAADMGSIG